MFGRSGRNVKMSQCCLMPGIPVLVLGILLAGTAAADLNSEISELYGSLSNATRPGAFETERRGVISGGELTVRTPIKSLDPVTVTLPHAGAGCSGIELKPSWFQ